MERKKFGMEEEKSEIKAIMMRNTVSVSDGGIKRGKNMGQWEKEMVLVHVEEMREENKWGEMCPRPGKVFSCLSSMSSTIIFLLTHFVLSRDGKGNVW
jgi:hypothetical protein